MTGKIGMLILIVVLAVLGVSTYNKSITERDHAFISSMSANAVASSQNNNSQPKPVQQTAYKMNQDVQSDKLTFSVSHVKTDNKITYKLGNQTFSELKTENKWVIVQAKVTNNDNKPRKISASLFALEDGHGRIFYDDSDAVMLLNGKSHGLFGQYEPINPSLSALG